MPAASTITPEPTPDRDGEPPLGPNPSGMPSRKKSSNGVPRKGLSPLLWPPFEVTFRAFVSLRTTTTLGVAFSAAFRNAWESAFAAATGSADVCSAERSDVELKVPRVNATIKQAGTKARI